jgi:hypothetical protein
MLETTDNAAEAQRILCKNDILYFVAHCSVVDLTHGSIHYVPTPFQAETMLSLQNGRFVFGMSDRQVGKTTSHLMFALWKALHWKNAQVFFRLPNRSIGILYCNVVAGIYHRLAEHMSVPALLKSDGHIMEFDNGSRLHFGMNRFSLVGVNWPTVLVDEFAWVQADYHTWLPELWTDVMARRGTLGIITSPNSIRTSPQGHEEVHDFSDIPRDTFMRVIEAALA